MAKTLYHSELCKLGPVEVTVKSDILQSKYAGKPDYVVLEVNGEDRNYSFDTDECKVTFDGQKGQTFTIIAEGSGKDGSATVTYVGEGGGTPQRKPTARPQARPAAPSRANPQPRQQNLPLTHSRPAAGPSSHVPNGARVGAAINKAVDYLIASTQDWNPNTIYEYASDLMRVSERLEQNKLARPFTDRKGVAAPAEPTEPQEGAE